MRALVTGASGFAGKHLISHLLSAGDEVTAGDLAPGADLLDVSDAASCRRVLEAARPEAVYHLAGMAFGPDAERDFSRALTVNVLGVYNVLQACRELELKCRVLVISSSEVHGRIAPGMLPLTEAQAPLPGNNYGLSKAMAELAACRFGAVRGGLEPVVIRAFNHIGPGQRPDFVVASFAQQLAEIARGRREAVLKTGNLEARRDFTDVRDIVRGYRLAALAGGGPYNLCSGRAVSIRGILEGLIEISGVQVRLEADAQRMRPSETPEIIGSNEKAGRELGWKPEIELRQSLRDIYGWWFERMGA